MKKIQLGGHYKNSKIKGYAIIDDEDFLSINKYNWLITNNYARTTTNPSIAMHRMINNTPDGMITDHINRNTLDNRRLNLRTVDKSINAINAKLNKTNTSGYKGIHFAKNVKKWEVSIFKNYKKIGLGYFEKIERAIEVRKQAELIYHKI